MKNLRNKIALVTGAGSGIGRAISLKLAREGADVVIADLNEASLNDTAEAIRALGRQALPVVTDIAKRKEVEKLGNQALKTFGRVDILVNNAGVALYAELKDTSLKDWEWIMGVNLWGQIYALHYLLPQMIAQRSGHIVNLASWMGLFAAPANGAYAVSKHGVVALSEALRTEVAQYNIGVTVVCPGVVRTNIFNSLKIKGYNANVRRMPSYAGITPETMADRIIAAIKHDRAMVVTGIGKLGYYLKRLSPALAQQRGRGGLWLYSRYKTESQE